MSWASLAVWAAFGAAVVAGCGGAGGSAIPGQDGGPAGDSSGSSSGGGPQDGSSTGSGSSGGSSGSASGASSSGADASNPIDASLDIAFPDSFYGPEASTPEGGSEDGPSEGGTSCAPDGITCQGSVAYDCSGGVLTTTDCSQQTTNTTCANGFGCVVCQPGSGTCNGNTGTACNSTGTGTVTNSCDPLQGLTCSDGVCVGACADLGESYIGCEYYAVTMANNWLNQAVFYFSVSVSNTGAQTATVTVDGGALASPVTQTIAPGALQEIKLPWVPAISCGTGPCNVDGGQPPAPGTALTSGGAYHIRSTQPVTVYQFNARDYQIGSDYSYTNDASLLIPVNALTGNYRVASWPSFDVEPGYITVVGTQNGTKVSVGASSALQAGAGLTSTGGTVTINAGDVLQIASAVNGSTSYPWAYGTDPSGSSVTVLQGGPVEVFGAHACVYIWTPTAACDHMEQITLPVETLRGDYLVTLPYNQNGTPQQYVKIVGTQANTHITFDPAVEANQTLNAGTVVTFNTTQNFHVRSTDNPPQAFLVAQYMMGEDNFTASDTAGDPSESVAVATAQFRNSYQFVAPANYEQNWVNVIAPAGANITVDGSAVSGYAAIGGSGFGVQHVLLSGANNGVHQASGNVPFGIEVYGYGSYTSYMYPGGLNLSRQ